MVDSARTLVTWYGSLAGAGTIGDLLAVQAVTTRLHAIGHAFRHSSATTDFGIPDTNVALNAVDPESVDNLIFVCGPIIAGHAVPTDVIGRFPSARRIGISISLFDRQHPNWVNPFDWVFAREGLPRRFDDVAILAPRQAEIAATPRDGPLRLGLVQNGPQYEYGPERSAPDEVAAAARSAIAVLRAHHDVQVVEIEHLLRKATVGPGLFDQLYSTCDLIITSRFHGAIMAMRNGVPFIAIDPIRGGAKVTSLLAGRGWPHVYAVPAAIEEAALDILEHLEFWRGALRQHANAARLSASHTLEALEQLLLDQGRS